ncbi:hypothetical protein Back11_48580 [Paenibacillus baekrokdamisoli]|uniref:Uncharacterized protein n=1 Tax=Paenibacillus baekrokdamisoli TaxID=1712516 RepID=A0A3G9JEW9_9BACL|nr:hypothetical protein [Paenibacillus baekrokdamisoli]MBB3068681.1 hypothetical protein [Paenibacillus baekrokdamisoli]BBH23513.1 hypothetical protein Back11_48580 [Paenibacillus baekrokdamisoli]
MRPLFKKMACYGIVLMLFVGLLPIGTRQALASEPNTALNPGFETDIDSNGVPDGWDYTLVAGGTAALATNLFYSGGKSVKLSGSSSLSRSFVNQWYVPAVENTRYTMSSWIKTNNVTAGFAGLELVFYNSSHQSLASVRTSVTQGTHDWQKVETSWISPPGTVSYAFRVALDFGSGDLWADSVASFVADEQNLLLNGNMETDIDNNSVPDGYDYSVASGGSGSLVTAEKYQGQKSVRLQGSSTSSRSFASQWYLPAQEYKEYQFQAKLKTNGVTLASGNGFVGLEIAFYDEGHQLLQSARQPANSGTHDWEQVSLSKKAPADTAFFSFRMVLDYASGNAWFDAAEAVSLVNSNLLLNGSLERDTNSDSIPDGWDYTLLDGGTAAVSTSVFREGAGSVRLSGVNASSRAAVNQWSVPINGGSFYRFSIEHKTSSVSAQFVGFELGVYNSSHQVIDNRRFAGSPGTHDWQEITVNLKLPDNASYVAIRPFLDFGSGDVWFDNARITKLTEQPSPVILPLSGLFKGTVHDTLSLKVKNSGNTRSLLDTFSLLGKTLAITSSSQLSDGASSYSYTLAGDLTFDAASSTIALNNYGEGTIEISGTFTAEAGALITPVALHEKKSNSTILYKLLNRGYGTLQDSTVWGVGQTILSSAGHFDSHLDTLLSGSVWKTYHGFWPTDPQDADTNSITSIYRIYAAMYDITRNSDYLDKAHLAAEQLLNTQQANGGWVLPWDYTSFGALRPKTETNAVNTQQAMLGLYEAYLRFGKPEYLDALEKGKDYMLTNPGTKYVWLDTAHTRGTVPYYDMLDITINGVTGPAIEIYNVDATALNIFGLMYNLTSDADLVPYMNGLINNLKAVQYDSGSWPYGWRLIGETPAAYNFVQSLDLASYNKLHGNSDVEDMLLKVLGDLGNRYADFPVLKKELAAVANLDFTDNLLTYINSKLALQNVDGSFLNDTRSGTAFMYFMLNALTESGYKDPQALNEVLSDIPDTAFDATPATRRSNLSAAIGQVITKASSGDFSGAVAQIDSQLLLNIDLWITDTAKHDDIKAVVNVIRNQFAAAIY